MLFFKNLKANYCTTKGRWVLRSTDKYTMHTLRYYINLIKESELVEPKFTTKTVQNLDLEKLEKFRKKDTNQASGYYAYAKELDPHQIKLTSYRTTSTHEDAKFTYIQAIKHLVGSNPYVPTIYEIKVVKAKNISSNLQKPTYIMQKLVNYKAVPTLALFAECKRLLKTVDDLSKNLVNPHNLNVINGYNDLKDTISSLTPKIMSGESDNIVRGTNYDINRVILYFLEDLLDKHFVSNDSNLNAVVDIIRNLIDTGQFNNDLHSENIMYRPTNFGYQLVITDPLS